MTRAARADRRWPLPVAVVSAVVFGLVVPAGAAVATVLAGFGNIGNYGVTPEEDRAAVVALTVGLVSGLLAAAGGALGIGAGHGPVVRGFAVASLVLGILALWVYGPALLTHQPPG
jgi:hypothetical protein